MTWEASVQRESSASDILCDDASAEMYCPLKILNDFFEIQIENRIQWFALWSIKFINECDDVYLKSKYNMKIESTPAHKIILLK